MAGAAAPAIRRAGLPRPAQEREGGHRLPSPGAAVVRAIGHRSAGVLVLTAAALLVLLLLLPGFLLPLIRPRARRPTRTPRGPRR
jgi:hypothetical protein